MPTPTVNSISELQQFIGQQKRDKQHEDFQRRFTWPEEEPLADWERELLEGCPINRNESKHIVEGEIVDFSGEF